MDKKVKRNYNLKVKIRILLTQTLIFPGVKMKIRKIVSKNRDLV